MLMPSAISSLRFRAGSAGWTTTSKGARASSDTGARSRRGSKGSADRLGFTAIGRDTIEDEITDGMALSLRGEGADAREKLEGAARLLGRTRHTGKGRFFSGFERLLAENADRPRIAAALQQEITHQPAAEARQACI